MSRESLCGLESWMAIGGPEQVEIGPPKAADSLPAPLVKKVGSHGLSRPFVAQLTDVELVGPDAVAVSADNRYILEESVGSIPRLIRGLLRCFRNRTLPRQSHDTADQTIECGLSLAGPWSGGYYHWFSDYLTRLQGLQRYIDLIGHEPTLIIPSDPPEWMIRSLELAGFGHLARIEWAHDRIHINNYVVSSLRKEFPIENATPIPSVRAHRWLANQIKGPIQLDGTQTNIYISREKARERHVVNEAQVMELLDQRGFRKYVLEEVPFDEQVKLFSGADIVIAPHGAGLVNTIFCDDVTIVELFGQYQNACYFTLAQGLGFKYCALICESQGMDMKVDVDRLSNTLDGILKQ
jgi:hypothetical protein